MTTCRICARRASPTSLPAAPSGLSRTNAGASAPAWRSTSRKRGSPNCTGSTCVRTCAGRIGLASRAPGGKPCAPARCGTPCPVVRHALHHGPPALQPSRLYADRRTAPARGYLAIGGVSVREGAERFGGRSRAVIPGRAIARARKPYHAFKDERLASHVLLHPQRLSIPGRRSPPRNDKWSASSRNLVNQIPSLSPRKAVFCTSAAGPASR